MARYGTFNYSKYTYGGGRSVTRSSLLAQVVDYAEILVSAITPARVGDAYALVRTYNGAAEHPAAGLVVSSGTVTSTEFAVADGDSASVTLIPGWVYYTLFVFDENGSWTKDAATSVLLPQDRGTLDYVISAIPSVYTSADGNPITPPDENSDLYRFLRGFALSYDELASAVDTVLPDNRSRSMVRRMHDAYATSVGMPSEYTIGVAASARLHRESGYIYRNKGTVRGLRTYVEALTGWQTIVTESPNLFLSLDDSSFETSTGNWEASGGTLIREVVNGSVTSAGGLYLADEPLAKFAKAAVGKFTLSSANGTMSLPSGTSVLTMMPVTAGADYRLEIPVRAASGTPNVNIAIQWRTQYGVPVSTSSGTAANSTASWVARTVTATAPATAAFASVTVTVTGSSGNAAYFDMLSFTPLSGYINGTFAYRDPRSVNVFCSPNRVNLIKDPSFEGSLANWSASAGTLTQDSTTAYSGISSGKITGTNFSFSSNSMPVNPTYRYTVLFSYRSTDGSLAARVDWYTSGGSLLSSTTLSPSASSAWVRYSSTVKAPDNAAYAKVTFIGSGTSYVDTVLFEPSDGVATFFDGSIADSLGVDASWQGSPAASYSLLYPSRPAKLARLKETLAYYLPNGVGYRVMLWDSADPEAQYQASIGL